MAGVNADLWTARQGASFPVDELTTILDGGEERTKQRKMMLDLVSKEPLFDDRDENGEERDQGHVRQAGRHREV